jgi:hypothetical protein
MLGVPYYGSFATSLRACEAPSGAHTHAHAREPELSHEASQSQAIEPQMVAERSEIAEQAQPLEQPMPEWPSMLEWRPIPECARPLPRAARRACEHPNGESGGLHGFGGVHSDW